MLALSVISAASVVKGKVGRAHPTSSAASVASASESRFAGVVPSLGALGALAVEDDDGLNHEGTKKLRRRLLCGFVTWW